MKIDHAVVSYLGVGVTDCPFVMVPPFPRSGYWLESGLDWPMRTFGIEAVSARVPRTVSKPSFKIFVRRVFGVRRTDQDRSETGIKVLGQIADQVSMAFPFRLSELSPGYASLAGIACEGDETLSGYLHGYPGVECVVGNQDRA